MRRGGGGGADAQLQPRQDDRGRVCTENGVFIKTDLSEVAGFRLADVLPLFKPKCFGDLGRYRVSEESLAAPFDEKGDRMGQVGSTYRSR